MAVDRRPGDVLPTVEARAFRGLDRPAAVPVDPVEPATLGIDFADSPADMAGGACANRVRISQKSVRGSTHSSCEATAVDVLGWFCCLAAIVAASPGKNWGAQARARSATVSNSVAQTRLAAWG